MRGGKERKSPALRGFGTGYRTHLLLWHRLLPNPDDVGGEERGEGMKGGVFLGFFFFLAIHVEKKKKKRGGKGLRPHCRSRREGAHAVLVDISLFLDSLGGVPKGEGRKKKAGRGDGLASSFSRYRPKREGRRGERKVGKTTMESSS